MGKHRLKYRAMKFPSRQNGTLIPDQDSESDIQEFVLPKKRVLKPGKNPYVTRRRPGCCRTCASIILSLILIASILCVVVLGWFSLRLKRDLDLLKRRLGEVETSDRSTSKECASRGNDLQKKVEALRSTTASVVLSDEKHFKSLLQKLSVLNRTVDYLKQRLKSSKSISSMHNDISLLKKAMADTGREMSEVTDKVAQLRRIARLENNNIKQLKIQMYNVTVQIAKLSGQPTPRPVVSTATPPWLLRVPADSDSQAKTKKLSSIEAEKLKKNITSYVKKDISKIVAYVKKANKSVHHQVRVLQLKLSALTENVSKQKALMDKLMKKANQDSAKNNVTLQQSHAKSTVDDSIMHQINNLTNIVDMLTSHFGAHDRRFEELVIDVSSINHTVYRHVTKNEKPVVAAACNCSLDSVWKAMSKDEDIVKSLQAKLETLRESLENLNRKEVSPTTATLPATTEKKTLSIDKEPKTPTTLAPKKVTSQPKLTQENTSHTEKPTTSAQQQSTVARKITANTSSSKPNQTKTDPTTTANTPIDNKRITDEEEDGDLNPWQGEDSDELPPITKESPIENDQ